MEKASREPLSAGLASCLGRCPLPATNSPTKEKNGHQGQQQAAAGSHAGSVPMHSLLLPTLPPAMVQQSPAQLLTPSPSPLWTPSGAHPSPKPQLGLGTVDKA